MQLRGEELLQPAISRRKLLHQRRIEKLLVTNAEGRLTGLLTLKDTEQAVVNPTACKDSLGRLRVAAASTVGDAGFERTQALVDAGVDMVVIDTAHGHSAGVAKAVERAKSLSNEVQVVAGNVATAEATRALIGAGASLASPGGPWRSPGVGSETYVPGGTCGDALRRIFARSAGEATNISENAGASVAATSGASATCPFSRPAFGDPPPLVGVCKTEDASRARSVRALRIFASAAGEADIMSVNADGGGIARAGTARRRLRRAPRRDETRIRLIGAITCYFSRQRVSVAGAPRHRPEKASAAPATHRRTRVAASLAHAPAPPSRRRAFSRPRLGPRRHAP